MIARVLSSTRRCVGLACRSRALVSSVQHRLTSSKQSVRKISTANDENGLKGDDSEDMKPFNVSKLLYPETEDETIQQIRNCSTLKELSKFLENVAHFEKSHVCQLILSLSQAVDSDRYINGKKAEVDFDPVLARVSQVLDEFTEEEVAVTFHYLNRLKFSVKHPTMEFMTNRILRNIEGEELFSSKLLFHFTSALKSDKGLYSSYLEAQESHSTSFDKATRNLLECRRFQQSHFMFYKYQQHTFVGFA